MPLTAPHQLTIATRESQLALWQAHYVRDRLAQLYPRCRVEILGMTTTGDQILDSPLNKVGGKGLFVKELEVALQNGAADIAVHSMKDVPMELPDGFDIITVDEREDPRDAFVSNHYAALDALPPGSVVGTSSLRRESQVRFHHPNLEVVSLRGNVQTRLKKLDNGGYHAVLLAAAGLKRLGLGQRIRAMLSVEQSLPAVGQGALAIEFRAARNDVRRWLAPLSSAETGACVAAERAMSRRLAGSCNVPLAAHAQLRGAALWLQGMVAMPDGSQLLRDEIEGAMDDAESLGVTLAEKLLQRGAGELLQRLSK